MGDRVYGFGHQLDATWYAQGWHGLQIASCARLRRCQRTWTWCARSTLPGDSVKYKQSRPNSDTIRPKMVDDATEQLRADNSALRSVLEDALTFARTVAMGSPPGSGERAEATSIVAKLEAAL